jgi:hypothetical protein
MSVRKDDLWRKNRARILRLLQPQSVAYLVYSQDVPRDAYPGAPLCLLSSWDQRSSLSSSVVSSTRVAMVHT